MEFDNKCSVKKKDLEGKYVFWDIDGTLAPYRFNGHLASPDGDKNGMSLEEIENGVFLQREPSKFMQKVVSDCNAKKNIVCGHVLNEKEIADKMIWLDKFYPKIKERLLFFEDVPKHEKIIAYCKKNKIDIEKVVFIDDTLDILKVAERAGIKSYHISSFLDYFEEN